MRKLSYSHRALILLCGFVSVVLMMGASIYWYKANQLDDGYAQFATGQMVVDFLKKNENRWPRSWDDLKPQYQVFGRKTGWTLDDFNRRIFLDFTPNIDALLEKALAKERPVFSVIRAKYTSGFYSLENANETIARYFREGSLCSADPSHRDSESGRKDGF